MEGTRRYSFQPPKHAGRAAHAVHFLSALYTSLCIFPSAGPGKTSSVAPWHDCAPCHSQPDGSPSATDPPSGQLNVPANSRQLGPPGALPAYRLPNYPRMAARPPTSCQWGCPHAALIPIYWNLARPVRLPLPIIPCVNDTDVSLRWIRAYECSGLAAHLVNGDDCSLGGVSGQITGPTSHCSGPPGGHRRCGTNHVTRDIAITASVAALQRFLDLFANPSERDSLVGSCRTR